MTANGNAPLVTIVGRPNVGKSTLFNRLLARRRAITAAMPGVTRDIVEAEFVLAGMPLRLLDTGGVGDDAGEFGAVVAERALAAADDAAAIMLVVAVEGITPEDERLADRLRAASDRVVVVVNKVDHPGREAAMWDFYRLGYETVIGVSAAHGRNISTLREELARGIRRRRPAAGSAEAAQSTPAVIRLVIGGKPNTGKSTLLNRLLGEERALVSATPGTTRDPLSGRLDYGGVQIELIDTAGMRRRSKVQDAVEYYSVNRGAAALAGADVALLLVDASEGLAEQDKRIAAIAMRRGVAVLIGLSKWDMLAEQPEPLAEQPEPLAEQPEPLAEQPEPLAEQPEPLAEQPEPLAAAVDRIRFQFPLLHFAPVLPLSGLTGYGVDAMLTKAVELHRQLNLTISTGKLNQAIARWAREYVPTFRGREIRVRYATQTGTNPVRFVCFLNHARGADAAYRRFLENRIRRELGFSEVPLAVEFRTDAARTR